MRQSEEQRLEFWKAAFLASLTGNSSIENVTDSVTLAYHDANAALSVLDKKEIERA